MSKFYCPKCEAFVDAVGEAAGGGPFCAGCGTADLEKTVPYPGSVDETAELAAGLDRTLREGFVAVVRAIQVHAWYTPLGLEQTDRTVMRHEFNELVENLRKGGKA